MLIQNEFLRIQGVGKDKGGVDVEGFDPNNMEKRSEKSYRYVVPMGCIWQP